MPIGQGMSYNVDIVMCIDKTGSMYPIMDTVKANAINFYKNFVDKMEEKGRRVEELRIKVIGFGDYGVDARPMMISDFFTLPAQNDAFEEFVNGINAEGGGDEPENALEAIAHAIQSEWTDGGNVRRHVIMLFTDTSALKLGTRTDFSKDTEQISMPSDLAELGDWWADMEKRAKRFVVFAPNGYPWDDMIVSWDNIVHVPSKAGDGCEEIDFDEAIRILVESVGENTTAQ